MRYVLGVLAFILVIFLAVALIFGRGGDKTPVTNTTVTKLVEYADRNSSVSLTTTGKLVGEESRQAVRVIVTPNERRLEILTGYEETVTSVQTYPNTQEAYSNFLSALATAGFEKSRKSTITDPRGQCPTGNRYVYDLSQDGNHISNLWSTSCNKNGTFAGTGTTIRQLFQLQIPDYSKQITGVKL
jgi:hypothetical protein